MLLPVDMSALSYPVLSVTLVYYGEKVTWIKMKQLAWRPRPWPHCVRWRPSPQFCPCLLWSNGWMDQDATWYGGIELGPGDIVLDGDPAPLPKRGGGTAARPQFPVRVLWPNVWMDQGATWYRGSPWPRPHCVRCGPAPPPKGQSPPIFGPCLLLPLPNC